MESSPAALGTMSSPNICMLKPEWCRGVIRQVDSLDGARVLCVAWHARVGAWVAVLYSNSIFVLRCAADFRVCSIISGVIATSLSSISGPALPEFDSWAHSTIRQSSCSKSSADREASHGLMPLSS